MIGKFFQKYVGSEGLGGLLTGIAGIALVAIGGLFNKQKAEVQSLGDQVRGNVEQIERVRGLIAGETTIAVAQLSENLAMAMRPTNEILMQILRTLQQMSGQPATGGAYSGMFFGMEVLGAQVS